MKAITLTQPWATLVAIGAKRIETRSWPTSYRGPLWLYRMLMWCVGPRFMWQMRSHGTQIVRSPCGRIGVKHHKQIWCSYHDTIEATDARTH